jgi:hypothetical protein
MHKILIFFGLFLLIAPMAQAHGPVTSQSQTTGGYTVEFEYNTFGHIIAGDVTNYNVFLLDSAKNTVDFDSAYMKISNSKGGPVLYATLKEAADIPGSARMGGILKDGGEYTATVQFSKAGKIIGPLTYKFTVDGEAKVDIKQYNKYLLFIPAGLGIAGLIMALALKMRHDKKKKS